MESMTSNPIKFADWFNLKHPGAPRQITVDDVENLKSCDLIHRYGFYSTFQDGKTVMGILKYEQMQKERSTQNNTKQKDELPTCKMCGQSFSEEPEDKSGRPKEYCPDCAPVRNKERQRKLRWRRR